MVPGIRLVTGGGIRLDYLIDNRDQIHSGVLGGNAIYAGVGASIWSDRVGIWGRVGQNYPATKLFDLRDHGISTEGLVYLNQNCDHRTFYAYLPSGERSDTDPASHFARLGRELPTDLDGYVHSTPRQGDLAHFEPLALRPGDWSTHFEQALGLHLAPMPIQSHLEICEYLHRQMPELIITLDPGERYMRPEMIPWLRQYLPKLATFLPSKEEVYSLFDDEVDLHWAADQFCRWGANVVIIKSGPKGALVYDSSDSTIGYKRAYHSPGDPKVVDVTGAGDSFCGGYLAGLIKSGGDVQEAVGYGTVSASFAVEGFGALHALKYGRQQARQRLTAYLNNNK